MAHRLTRIRTVVAVAAFVLVTGCSTLSDSHGYTPEASALEQIVVGRDTRDTVELILGRPGTEGLVDEQGWYYVRSDFDRFLWRAPVETNREIVAISFTDAGVVSNVERFGLEEGRVVVLSRRVTTSNTAGVSFLRQLFSNVGQFDAGQLFDN